MKTLVFSHANSYPAACYRLLFEHWQAAGWTVHALPLFGHDPRFPVSANWPHLLRQLLAFIDGLPRGDTPAVLVGHSLGGVLSLMAAARRPELARAVVQLDSPYVRGWRRGLLAVSQWSGLALRLPPATVALQRREHWPDRAALAAHFRGKALFQAWDARVLDDYLVQGFEPDPERGGWRLRFRREIEAHIYAGLPHSLPSFGRALRTPIGFIAGTRSREMRLGGLAATRHFIGARHFRQIEGSHLFPMERPLETAALVLALLDELSGASR